MTNSIVSTPMIETVIHKRRNQEPQLQYNQQVSLYQLMNCCGIIVSKKRFMDMGFISIQREKIKLYEVMFEKSYMDNRQILYSIGKSPAVKHCKPYYRKVRKTYK